MSAPDKHKRCGNCLHEGDREAEKCDRGVPRNHADGCVYHDFRPGWDLQGTLFEGLE